MWNTAISNLCSQQAWIKISIITKQENVLEKITSDLATLVSSDKAPEQSKHVMCLFLVNSLRFPESDLAKVLFANIHRLPVFHLNKKEAKRELNINFNNETLPFCSEPKYLGVTLDRSLTHRRHLESLPVLPTLRFSREFGLVLLWICGFFEGLRPACFWACFD